MKKVSLLTILSILALSSAWAADIHYVQLNATGDGSSWQSPFGDLQEALAIAKSGDQIWVAAGTYLPSATDRMQSFNIPEGVKLYGGFKGTETEVAQRNWQINQTTLSGDLGKANDLSDNSQTIVLFDGVTKATLLDGFFIIDGSANGYEEGADLSVCGAAIYNRLASPTIENCIFRNNYARNGAAIYNYAKDGMASPVVKNCKFLSNKAEFNGGAIFNDADNGICNARIEACNFEGNYAIYGGGMLNQGAAGLCKPLVINCAFVDNYSVVRGSAVYNLQEGSGQIGPIVKACRFENNGSNVGEDIEDTSNIVTSTNSSGGGSIQMRSGH